MTKKTGLAVIQKRTTSLWYKVVLSKGYTEEIARGTAQVNAKLKELLEA